MPHKSGLTKQAQAWTNQEFLSSNNAAPGGGGPGTQKDVMNQFSNSMHGYHHT